MSSQAAQERARDHLLASAAVKQRVAATQLSVISQVAEVIVAAFRSGNKVMLCGNGGSAADAQHIAAEFTNGLRAGVKRPALAGLALTTDTSFLTAHANDYGFVDVFSRQIEALGNPGDVLIAISTSGNSGNVVRAVQACPDLGVQTVGLLGGDGGQLANLVDLPVVVPSEDTQHIQEAHIAIGHVLADLVDRELFESETFVDGAHGQEGSRQAGSEVGAI